jgi:hypothetical protein
LGSIITKVEATFATSPEYYGSKAPNKAAEEKDICTDTGWTIVTYSCNNGDAKDHVKYVLYTVKANDVTSEYTYVTYTLVSRASKVTTEDIIADGTEAATTQQAYNDVLTLCGKAAESAPTSLTPIGHTYGNKSYYGDIAPTTTADGQTAGFVILTSDCENKCGYTKFEVLTAELKTKTEGKVTTTVTPYEYEYVTYTLVKYNPKGTKTTTKEILEKGTRTVVEDQANAFENFKNSIKLLEDQKENPVTISDVIPTAYKFDANATITAELVKDNTYKVTVKNTTTATKDNGLTEGEVYFTVTLPSDAEITAAGYTTNNPVTVKGFAVENVAATCSKDAGTKYTISLSSIAYVTDDTTNTVSITVSAPDANKEDGTLKLGHNFVESNVTAPTADYLDSDKKTVAGATGTITLKCDNTAAQHANGTNAGITLTVPKLPTVDTLTKVEDKEYDSVAPTGVTNVTYSAWSVTVTPATCVKYGTVVYKITLTFTYDGEECTYTYTYTNNQVPVNPDNHEYYYALGTQLNDDYAYWCEAEGKRFYDARELKDNDIPAKVEYTEDEEAVNAEGYKTYNVTITCQSKISETTLTGHKYQYTFVLSETLTAEQQAAAATEAGLTVTLTQGEGESAVEYECNIKYVAPTAEKAGKIIYTITVSAELPEGTTCNAHCDTNYDIKIEVPVAYVAPTETPAETPTETPAETPVVDPTQDSGDSAD